MSRINAAERAAIDSRRVQRVYATLAKVYDDCFDWALGPGRRRAVERLDVAADHRVLEVGVGTGLSLPYYRRGCHVSGIDISEPMLEKARERVEELGRDDVDLRLMDARELSYPDGTFDRVLAPYVISVVPEPERVMAEMRRVTKPDGKIVVVNHFGSVNAAARLFERVLTPASQWIGFRLDLPLEIVTGAEGLDVVAMRKVNLFGLWRLIELQRTDRPSAT